MTELVKKFNLKKVKAIVPGGETGQLSIFNGLEAAEKISEGKESVVLIHDGVRPLINSKVIRDNIECVKKNGSAITTAPAKETIVLVNGSQEVSEVVDRTRSFTAKAPQSFNLLMERFSLDRESLDYFVMHQANYFMNNKIRKKLKLPEEKVPYSMPLFGNTSSASIPLTLVTACSLRGRRSKIAICGFGVGLSWGTGYFELDENVVISDLVEI